MKLVKVTIPACLGGRKLAVFAALATLVCAADTITVAQGDTQNITAAATVTAMEVHGTLNLQGTASAAAELTFDPKDTKAYLGSAPRTTGSATRSQRCTAVISNFPRWS